MNLRPLGYETDDARLRCLGPSPVTALTSADLRREVCLGLPRLPCLSPSRCVCAQIRAQNRFLTCGFLCLPLRTCAHPHLPEHPVTVDQPVRERARPCGSSWSARLDERAGPGRPGLLGSAWSTAGGMIRPSPSPSWTRLVHLTPEPETPPEAVSVGRCT